MAPDVVTLLDRETRKLNLLRATISLCSRDEKIAELTRLALAVPAREVDSPDYCTDRMQEYGSQILWWEMSEPQLARLCAPCRSRVDLWRERAQLRRGLGGVKRGLRVAFRAYMRQP